MDFMLEQLQKAMGLSPTHEEDKDSDSSWLDEGGETEDEEAGEGVA